MTDMGPIQTRAETYPFNVPDRPHTLLWYVPSQNI